MVADVSGPKVSSAETTSQFFVSVLLERRLSRSGPWHNWVTQASAVVAGESWANGAVHCTLIGSDDEGHRLMWSGISVKLYKDACESYWYNLLSPQPSLFVICFEAEEPETEAQRFFPAFVTASQDEANAHMEADDLVSTVPMPEQVHQWVERFVVAHYQPEIKKKRKRNAWSQTTDEGRQDEGRQDEGRPGEGS